MTWVPEMEELELKRELARRMGGAEGIERQHAQGRLTVRERIDHHGQSLKVAGNVEFSADLGLACRLGALSVVVDLAPFDGLLGLRPGLENARRPQPTVESDLRLCGRLCRGVRSPTHGMISSKPLKAG